MAHYLQAVAALKDEKGFVRVGDVADRLGVSKSGVTSMLRTLHTRGYVDHERYGCVELTPTGRQLAERTESNRRVLSVFLSEVLGVSEEVAAEDACMIEHLVSLEAMVQFLRLSRKTKPERAENRTWKSENHLPKESCPGAERAAAAAVLGTD